LEPKARKKSVTIDCSADESLPPVQGDAERLRQVFLNLVDNAIKLSPEGGTVRVIADMEMGPGADLPEVGFSLVEPSRRMLEIRVIDSGIGIPEHERGRIFDAFYQIDSSSTREHEGTGLGLSIVKRLVDAHGGRVFVTANDPTGAVFSVALPTASS
jgi:signal transduction histidine kinase